MKKLASMFVAAMLAVAVLAAPATAAAQTTPEQGRSYTRAADVNFNYTEGCYYTTASVYFGNFLTKFSGETPQPRSTVNASVWVFDNCLEQTVFEDFVSDFDDNSSFKFSGTQQATINFSGTSTNGYPVDINLVWSAQGQPHTETYNFKDEFGCPFLQTGTYQTSTPYSVTGNLTINGTDFVAGHAPDYAVVFDSKIRALYTCE